MTSVLSVLVIKGWKEEKLWLKLKSISGINCQIKRSSNGSTHQKAAKVLESKQSECSVFCWKCCFAWPATYRPQFTSPQWTQINGLFVDLHTQHENCWQRKRFFRYELFDSLVPFNWSKCGHSITNKTIQSSPLKQCLKCQSIIVSV